MSKANRKHGRGKKSPAHKRYNAENRVATNKAAHLARDLMAAGKAMAVPRGTARAQRRHRVMP